MTALETLPGIGSEPTAAPGPPIPVLGVDNVLFSPLGDLALQRGDAERPLPPVRLAGCTPSAMGLPSSAQVYPDAVWPVQITDALRGLIHQANLTRAQALPAIPADTTTHSTRPGKNAKPDCCSRCCATALTTSCASPTTSRCPPPPTKPNATCGPPRSNRRSPGA